PLEKFLRANVLLLSNKIGADFVCLIIRFIVCVLCRIDYNLTHTLYGLDSHSYSISLSLSISCIAVCNMIAAFIEKKSSLFVGPPRRRGRCELVCGLDVSFPRKSVSQAEQT